VSTRAAWLKPLRHPLAWSLLWALAVIVVAVVSVLPAPDLPDAPGSDKLHHFLAYALLAASAVQLFARRALPAAGSALVLLGIALEQAQSMTASRMADPLDALANAAGVAAGLATAFTPLERLLLRLDGATRRR
jgi:VanZ family protein